MYKQSLYTTNPIKNHKAKNSMLKKNRKSPVTCRSPSRLSHPLSLEHSELQISFSTVTQPLQHWPWMWHPRSSQIAVRRSRILSWGFVGGGCELDSAVSPLPGQLWVTGTRFGLKAAGWGVMGEPCPALPSLCLPFPRACLCPRLTPPAVLSPRAQPGAAGAQRHPLPSQPQPVPAATAASPLTEERKENNLQNIFREPLQVIPSAGPAGLITPNYSMLKPPQSPDTQHPQTFTWGELSWMLHIPSPKYDQFSLSPVFFF